MAYILRSARSATTPATVTGGSLPSTSIGLSGVPASAVYGTPFTATATLSGSKPTGSINFLVNGAIYATVPLSSGSASYAFAPLPGSYSIAALYAGDSANGGSSSASSGVAVSAAPTSTSPAEFLAYRSCGYACNAHRDRDLRCGNADGDGYLQLYFGDQHHGHHAWHGDAYQWSGELRCLSSAGHG